jgi:hypothetical protein
LHWLDLLVYLLLLSHDGMTYSIGLKLPSAMRGGAYGGTTRKNYYGHHLLYTMMFSKNFKIGICLYLSCFSIYFIFLSNSVLLIDGYKRFDLTASLVEKGTVIESCKYAPGQSIIQIPLYLIGKLVASTQDWESPVYISKFFVNLLNPLITPLITVLLFLICDKMAFSKRTSIQISLIYAFCTMAFNYSRFNANEPLLSLILIASCYFLLCFKEDNQNIYFLAFCFMLFLLPIDNYAMFPLACILAVFSLVKRNKINLRSSHFVVVSLFIVFSALVCLYYNFSRYGSPWLTGYRGEGFTTPFYIGIYGLILSPAKSILLYNPVFLFTIVSVRSFIKGKYPPVIKLYFVTITCYLLIVYSMWGCWQAGAAWGPRFLVPMIPFLLIPIGKVLDDYKYKIKWKKFAIILVITISLIIQLTSVVVHFKHYYYVLSPPNLGALSVQETLNIKYSPFYGQFIILFQAFSHLDYFDLRWIKEFSNYPLIYGAILFFFSSLALVNFHFLRKYSVNG